MTKKIPCPNCGQQSEYSQDNPSRPFCSDRCKLLDLGEWADGNYTLASDEPLSEEDMEKVIETNDGSIKYDSH